MFQGGSRKGGIDQAIAGYQPFVDTTTYIEWEIIDPVVDIHCNEKRAVVSIEYRMQWTKGENKVNNHGKNLIFFVKENSEWLMTAEHYLDMPAVKLRQIMIGEVPTFV